MSLFKKANETREKKLGRDDKGKGTHRGDGGGGRRSRSSSAISRTQQEHAPSKMEADEPPLITAARTGDVSQLKTLLKEKADVNAANYFGQTALHWAAHEGRLECVRSLLATDGVNVEAADDISGRTPLFLSSKQGHVVCVDALMGAGAVVDAPGDLGETALHAAVRNDQVRCVQRLLGGGADIEHRETLWEETPLFPAARRGLDGVCAALLKAGACVGVVNEHGDTPLHAAARRGHHTVAQLLVDFDADPAALDTKGRPPAEVASTPALKADLQKYASVRTLQRLTDVGMESWTPHHVGEWLGAIGHGEYAPAFVSHHIDGHTLSNLDMASLKAELGITSMGHRAHIVDQRALLSRNKGALPEARAGDIAQIEHGDLKFYPGTLGKGHFGEVKRARWYGTDVAVKSIYREAYHADFSLFEKEVRILSRLRHPNVILIIGIARSPEGRPCIITEYLSRGSLASIIHDCPFVLSRPGMKASIVSDVAKGMAYLHANKPEPILHRDLTSHNLLLDSKLMAKVADFGLSRMKQEGHDGGSSYGVGQVPWMAPEVLHGKAYTTAADVYSFGCILYELCVLRPPHGDAPAMQYATQVQQGVRPDIPPSVEPHWRSIIEVCWAQDPSARPPFVHILSLLDEFPEDSKPSDAEEHDSIISTQSRETTHPAPGDDGYI